MAILEKKIRDIQLIRHPQKDNALFIGLQRSKCVLYSGMFDYLSRLIHLFLPVGLIATIAAREIDGIREYLIRSNLPAAKQER